MTSEHPVAPRWQHEDYNLSQLLEGAAGDILQKYSHIPRRELESHIKAIREKGWAVTKFPCFSRFLFLHFDLASSPAYSDLLEQVKAGKLFMDLGCCLGQDIRRLVYDGAPSENTIGVELKKELIDLGYELFRDQDHLRTTFITQDFLHNTPALTELERRVAFLNSGFFLHLWDWDGQIQVLKQMIKLLSLERGALITGVSFGSLMPGEWDNNPHGGKPMFVHDNSSFLRLWKNIEEETGTKWKIYTTLEEADGFDKLRPGDSGGRLQRWVAERA